MPYAFLPASLRAGLAAFMLMSLPAAGEESLRVVVIETTPKDAVAIRKLLADPAKNSDREAIKPVLALRGVKLHGDFKIEAPWKDPGRSQRLQKESGRSIKLENGAEIKAGVDGTLVSHGAKYDALELAIKIPGKGKTLRTLQLRESSKTYGTAKWEERASWSDGALTRMIWHYPSLDPAVPVASTVTPAKLEMAIFDAPKAELDKLLAVEPGDRAKAIEALRGKAKLINEGSYWTQSRTLWEDGLRVESRYLLDPGSIIVRWSVQVKVENGMRAATAEAPMTEGEWVIHALKDLPGMNLLVCRMTRQ